MNLEEFIKPIRFQIKDYEFIYAGSYVVNDLDIDHNLHLNNTSYPDICYRVSHITLTAYRSLDIDFLSDVVSNEILDIYYYKDDNTLSFIIKKNQKTVAKLFLTK